MLCKYGFSSQDQINIDTIFIGTFMKRICKSGFYISFRNILINII